MVSMSASVVSVNVARPRRIVWNGREVWTGIYKEAVAGNVRVGKSGMDGDQQADLIVHGGEAKAVYIYPSEHYAYWQQELQRSLPWGMFGENVTTIGLLEDSIHLGDKLRAGSAELLVTQPRFPCYKLGIKFGNMAIVQRFLNSGRSGFYLAVESEGEISVGDSISLVSRGDGPTIVDAFRSET